MEETIGYEALLSAEESDELISATEWDEPEDFDVPRPGFVIVA